MKTNEELNFKKEVEELSDKLSELDENEFEQISGGEKNVDIEVWVSEMKCNKCPYRRMWKNKYKVGSKFICNKCGEKELECIRNICISRKEI